ncbi:MAG TPA: DUF1800 domain-containing protein [Terracidiphilus sp.]|nr:DUF1800 domain-containing protein [Terracidiphilus sp.]
MRASSGHPCAWHAALHAALTAALLASAASLVTGCGGANINSADGARFTALSAPSTTVRVNQQIQLTSNGLKLGSPMTFYVNGIQGGNALLGTVDSTGIYTAPAIVPVPNTVTVTETSVDHPTFPQGSAVLSVLNPIPIINAVAPSTFPEGTAQIAVVGSQFVFGAQIVWNGAAVSTTLVSSTQLVANIPAPNPGTFPLLVSNPNPGAANSATVPVVVGPGQVVLTLQAGNGSNVRVSNPLNFGLTVNGTSNPAVTLQVNGVANGNAQIGTAVANANGSITYTAPPVVPTPSNVVQLTITSVDNPAVSITQNISVLNPIPILNTASPMTFNVGPPSATVVLTGQSFINGAQVLMNGTPVPTTFNSGTQLTATVSPTEPGNLDLQVLNPSPGPVTSADLIALVNGSPPIPIVTPADAARFLEQATFGATDASIHDLSMIGYQAWLNEQFALPPTPHEPDVETAVILNNPPCAAGDVKCNAALFVQNSSDEGLVQDSFWQQTIAGNDQLRQRVVYALTEMFVISSAADFNVQSMPRGEANYYDVLGADAFGNFRTLLQDVTLNPMMGQMLSMLGNDKGNATTDPDENYAREVMQLFTIGLYQLNDDGSQQLSGSGQPIPTYSNVDVTALAAVFTGFSWNIPGNSTDTAWSNCCLYVGPGYGEELLPMQSFPSHHSTVQKQFLGVTIPASGSPDPDGDLKIALDTLFNHPNLPAFFCKQMIQHLVTSNPSPSYISNCSAVFKDNGLGVRGDLKAVITEILLDPEARNSATDFSNPQYGKVREALLRYTEWARAFSAQSRTGSYGIGSTEDPIWGLGQMSLRSPTVFNWFAPGYVPPGTTIEAAGLVAPEMQMTNVSTVVGYLNFMQDSIGSNATSGFDIFASYETEMGLASNPTALLDRINLLLMAGEMNSTLYGQILGAISAIPIPSGDQNAINAALANRVKTAIYLTMASPAYIAQY